MKQYFASLTILTLFQLNVQAGLTFQGNSLPVVAVSPSPSSGLETVYVLSETSGVTVSYDGATSVKWSRFGANGAAYAEQMATSQSIALDRADYGYIAEVDGKEHYFWIVNYQNHYFDVTSLQPDQSQSDCQRTFLSFEGTAAPIIYYTINGRNQ